MRVKADCGFNGLSVNRSVPRNSYRTLGQILHSKRPWDSDRAVHHVHLKLGRRRSRHITLVLGGSERGVWDC